ncbi:MAG: lipoyl(octanoyl) transferase LipB [Candidatus Omnitrophica bacterium]|nr:lipoyl(octanoyl) transferase LipB [Candidatus Omnitrophota bacterium]
MEIIDLGLIDYAQAAQVQAGRCRDVCGSGRDECLIFCRHHPVITIGRSGSPANITASPESLRQKEIAVVRSPRGGDVTYHGPGQVMIYPILRLSRFALDLHRYLRFLEEAVIAVLAGCGIRAHQRPGLTGIWVGERKISSIGIRVQHWVSSHGIAVNVLQDDLVNFSCIRPCGMDIAMTSVETVTNVPWEPAIIQDRMARRLQSCIQ